MKSSGIGGQAVLEGIMMRNRDKYAVAVRKPDKEIEIKIDDYKSVFGNHKILKLPFVRGVFNFVDSMVVGMKCLDYSSQIYAEEEGQEPDKFDKFMTKLFGEKAEKVLSAVVIFVSIVLAVGIFALLPAWIGSLLGKVISSHLLVNFLEGVVRIAIFILYVWLISFMEDIKRTYKYHGAEHKCINCIEQGLPLTVDNVAASSKEHKRCGTSFMLIVMVISVLLFMVVDAPNLAMRFVSRIVLIPVVAGISYEFLRLAGNSDHWLVNALSRPGMWLQGLTTKEPERDMIEVAIAAVEAVFDWKAYQQETFGFEFPEEPPVLMGEPAVVEEADETTDEV